MVALTRASSSPPVIAGTIEEAPAVAGVYLLAFYRAGEHVAYGGASAHGRALHYCGYSDNIRERIAAHRAGRGNPLCRAAILAGYELRLVRVWPGRGRDIERSIKDRHNLARVCPDCLYHLAPDVRPAPGDPERSPRLWPHGLNV